MPSETISISAFARQLNIDESTVRHAIETGKIKNALIYVDGMKKPRIDPDLARQEWAQNFDPGAGRRTPEALTKALLNEVESISDLLGDDGESVILTDNSTYNEAARIEKIYRARLAELEFKKESGSLVSMDEVNRALFAMGKAIRESFQGLPDRTIDNILAEADDRNVAHNILLEAICEELEKVSNLTDTDLQL